MHPSGLWSPSNRSSKRIWGPTGWTPSWSEFEEHTRSTETGLSWASTTPRSSIQQTDGCRIQEIGEPAWSLPWQEEPKPPHRELSPWWRKGSSLAGELEPEREEEVMRRGGDIPFSTLRPPTVLLPCPSRWSNGGKDSRQPWEARDMASTFENGASSEANRGWESLSLTRGGNRRGSLLPTPIGRKILCFQPFWTAMVCVSQYPYRLHKRNENHVLGHSSSSHRNSDESSQKAEWKQQYWGPSWSKIQETVPNTSATSNLKQ